MANTVKKPNNKKKEKVRVMTKPRTFQNDLVYVAASAVAGKGVFAKHDIEKNMRCEVAPALRLTRNVDILSHTELEHYLFDGDDDHEAILGLGYSSMYNHSEHPNAEFSIYDDMIVIVALEDIAQHDEIFVNYGWDWETLVNAGIGARKKS